MAATVFLDIDGVITDHALLHDDYVAHLGEVLAPALGGTVEDWGRANAATFPELFTHLQAISGTIEDVNAFYEIEYRCSVQGMCSWLGIAPPSDEECIRLGRAFSVHVRGNSRAVFPQAAEMVRTLARDHDLHLATGNPSWLAEPLLEGIGVRDLVGLACGPDLIGVAKVSDAFHRTLFEAVGVAPGDAVVVDDSPGQVANARAAGAATVLVTREPVDGEPADCVVSGPSEVAGAIAALEARR